MKPSALAVHEAGHVSMVALLSGSNDIFLKDEGDYLQVGHSAELLEPEQIVLMAVAGIVAERAHSSGYSGARELAREMGPRDFVLTRHCSDTDLMVLDGLTDKDLLEAIDCATALLAQSPAPFMFLASGIDVLIPRLEGKKVNLAPLVEAARTYNLGAHRGATH